MYKKIFLFLIVLSFGKAEAQNSKCEPTLLYTISTESGMKLRTGPSTTAAVVVYVPAKSELLICPDLFAEATIENIRGHWRRVSYKGKFGYMFDGFLAPVNTTQFADFRLAQLLVINRVLAQDISKLDSVLVYLNMVARANGYERIIGPPLPDRDSLFEGEVVDRERVSAIPEKTKPAPPVDDNSAPVMSYKFITEAYNYCGDIVSLDPGKLWYAIFREGNTFYRKRVDLLVVRSKYSLGAGVEFDLKADRDLHPTFLLSPSKLMDTTWYVTQNLDFFNENPKAIFPGQLVELYGSDPVPSIQNVNLFATGNVISIGKCPVIENYKLQVSGEMNGDLLTQNLTPLFSDLGSCGIPEIYWFGDLNGDFYPEIIFVSTSNNGYTFTFFASDTRNNKMLYRKADEWFNKNCD